MDRRTDGRTDSGDTICSPIENGGGIKKIQVVPILPTKFRVNWPFGSGAEAHYRFSRWQPWPSSWISDQNDFSYF